MVNATVNQFTFHFILPELEQEQIIQDFGYIFNYKDYNNFFFLLVRLFLYNFCLKVIYYYKAPCYLIYICVHLID